MKKINLFLTYFTLIFYLEMIFRIFTFDKFFNISLLYIIINTLFISGILSFISNLFKEKGSKIFYFIVFSLITFWFAMEFCVNKFYQFFFSFSLIGAASQTLEFASDAVKVVISNLFVVLLLFIPIILSIIFKKKINFETENKIKYLLVIVLSIIIFVSSLFINKDDDYSRYSLFFNLNDISLNMEKLGVLNSLGQDIYKTITKFEEVITFTNPVIDKDEISTEITYEYNNLDIDFDTLIENESDAVIKEMHKYFQNEEGTTQNEYTGFFENKNLILFMAESFNEIAVDEERTPTLYKLINNGFTFTNFYTPTISSTIGGEFQELTGLYAASGFLSDWKAGTNYYPFGIAKVFQEKGYNTYAYHDSFYTFQSRHKYLAALGFTNFLGRGNGLENLMDCEWLASDTKMIEVTSSDWLNSDKPFMTFYATVSGHGDYAMTNSMAQKHADKVENLNYSDKVKAYLAQQVELDEALQKLLEILTENNMLDNTVIALVGDHYPYYLTANEVNEASSYNKDKVVEINHSNFILYNSAMDNVTVEKVGSQIDVLPTIYNLFNISYDSRLIIGKDILSTTPGLAMFGNRSWITDYGTYYASSSKFVLKEGKEVSEDYVKNMNTIVSNKIKMSSQIITKNYYKKVLG